ncbi:hypothetical protein [Mycobacterium lacus]|uniref:Uncharacterized protein n=1 Tax=Mycobacterium lacus TaxID=169765 RepID=A0A7I7NNM7_9MYCO|nr:hypothetical protein [Mycobacterium lacus]MCV7122160.1 hypothetical protein [Mycobacterium lacus]BBX97899.1 hypothetical protein MLAC_31930 [Mycobacterium lacus]
MAETLRAIPEDLSPGGQVGFAQLEERNAAALKEVGEAAGGESRLTT